MPTVRKPAPIQRPDLAPWAVQFVQFVELVATTASDSDAAVQSVTLAFGCMADLANVKGDEYRIARDSAVAYVRSLYWHRLLVRAENVCPFRGGDWNDTLEVVRLAQRSNASCLLALRDALTDIRPSLSLT
jgi:hypothetical protein